MNLTQDHIPADLLQEPGEDAHHQETLVVWTTLVFHRLTAVEMEVVMEESVHQD